MKLDKDICLGAKLNGKEVTEIKINNQYLYESEWPDDWNVYTIHMTSDMAGDHVFSLSEKVGNYENSYPLYIDWGNAHIHEQISDTTVRIYCPTKGTTFNIKTNYELATVRSRITDIISIRKDTTSLKNKFQSYSGKYIRQSVLDKLSHVKSDSMSYMFEGCENLISIDISNFDTSNVTDMSRMFSGCYKLETIELGDGFDTSNLKSAHNMFYYCISLKSIDLRNLKIKDMTGDIRDMFSNCRKLEYVNLSNASIHYYATVGSIFQNCTSLLELRLDNCGYTTISKIINSSNFPVNNHGTIYCKRVNAEGLTAPGNWQFSYID